MVPSYGSRGALILLTHLLEWTHLIPVFISIRVKTTAAEREELALVPINLENRMRNVFHSEKHNRVPPWSPSIINYIINGHNGIDVDILHIIVDLYVAHVPENISIFRILLTFELLT